MFQTKWLSKFRQFMYKEYIFPTRYPYSVKSICYFCEVAANHLRHFYLEARDLSLGPSDFPPPTTQQEKMPNHFRSAADVWRHITNPYHCAGIIMALVEAHVERLESIQEPGGTYLGISGLDLDVWWHQVIDCTAEQMERIRPLENERCKISDSDREHVRKTLKDSEETGDWSGMRAMLA